MLEDQDPISIQEVRHKVRRPEEALERPERAGAVDRQTVMAMVERYLRECGLIPEAPRVQAERPAAGHG